MSVVSMKKIWLCGLESEREALLRLVQKKRVLQVREEEHRHLTSPDVRDAVQAAERKAHAAEQALKILDRYAPDQGGLLASLAGVPDKSYEDWLKESREQADLEAKAAAVIEADKQVTEAKAVIVRTEMLMENILPWKDFPRPMNTEETQSCRILMGTLPGMVPEGEVRAFLAEEVPEAQAYEIEMIDPADSQTALILVCLKDIADEVEDCLRRKGFARPLIQSDKTPKELLAELETQHGEARQKAEEKENWLKERGCDRAGLQFLYDDATLEKGRLEAVAKAGTSKEVFFLTGYVPEKAADALKKELEEKFTCSVEFCPMEEGEAPVLLKNNSFSTPTESVVASYGLPGVGEIDPTSIMSIFYYVLFGLMLSDAGYGLLMVIGCGIALKKFPGMKKGTRQMLTMFFWCGVSTTVWGLLFGSFFGDVIDVVAHTFFGVDPAKEVFRPLWFAPIKKPMRLLIYSFLIGIIHLFTGLAIKGFQLLKQKRVMDFIGGVLSWYLLLIGLILLLLPSDLFASISGSAIPLPPAVQSTAKILAIAGAVGLLLFAAWDKKNFGLRLALGAYEIYGITGWLSDVLSYSRLLALGLATGVIASVINSMGTMFGGGVIGAIIFIVIFLVGHALNMAINLLGAYVHTNRLQYVEFFGKFYEGGGNAFEPMTADTAKYYHMEDI